MPFDLENSSFMKLYFGKDRKRLTNYAEFAQFLHVCFFKKFIRDVIIDGNEIMFNYLCVSFCCCCKDFHEECGTEAFRKFDVNGSGFISAQDFEKLMLLVKGHLLTEEVKNNLLGVSITCVHTMMIRSVRAQRFYVIFYCK